MPSGPYGKTQAVLSILLAHTCFVAISISSNWEHFTWWSIASTGVYAFVNAFFSITAGRYFFLFCSLQVSVLCGTLVMGFSKCDVFEDAYDDSGSVVYILGNFIMHFFPLIAAIIITDVTEIGISTVNDVCCSCALGLGVYFIWEFFEDPIEVYGCNNIKSSVIGLIGASCAVLFSGIVGSIFVLEYGEIK